MAREFLNESGIVLSWPSVLPDLNPIENFWVIMKSGLREKTVTGGNDELFKVLRIVTHISIVF